VAGAHAQMVSSPGDNDAAATDIRGHPTSGPREKRKDTIFKKNRKTKNVKKIVFFFK
jgi:hypothetical protein